MRRILAVFALGALLATPVFAGTILYNNLTPNDLMAMASRPAGAAQGEIEAADDFLLARNSTITNASFVGLLSGNASAADITGVTIEIYRVFPQDSDTNRTPNVPTRTNSPSDVALTDRSVGAGDLNFSVTTLAADFTANNSVLVGINPSPNQTTHGEGPVTGTEVQFDVAFTTPISLAPGHYFFVPQVGLGGSDNFFWLSASRPISGAGTTPLNPDLQTWIRDGVIDPDWLRVGTDIVGGSPAPTFNAAFQLEGTVPEPGSLWLLVAGAAGLCGTRRIRRSR